MLAQIGQGPDPAIGGRFPDLSVGHGLTYTDVHLVMIIILIFICQERFTSNRRLGLNSGEKKGRDRSHAQTTTRRMEESLLWGRPAQYQVTSSPPTTGVPHKNAFRP